MTAPSSTAAVAAGDRPASTGRLPAPVLAALAAVALVVRLAYWWTVRGEPLRSDASNYHELASAIAEGRGLSGHFPGIIEHATAWRPPLLPYLLGGVYRITGPDPGVARVVAMTIGVVLVVVTAVVVTRWAGRRAGLVAAALVAVYPPLVANDVVPLTESLSLVLLLGLVHMTLARRWAWAGVLCGLLLLTRPSAQALLVFLVVWFLVKIGWRAALGSAAVAVLVVAPWVVRNAVEVGSATLVTSNGFNLAALYSPQAQAAGHFVDPVFDDGFEQYRLVQLDEAKWDRELRAMALDNIRADPASVPRVVWRNLGAYFELTPAINESAERLDGRNLTIRSWTLPLVYAVSGVGLVGLWWRRRTDLAQLLAVVALSFTLASLVFVAPPRLRAPFDLVMCIGVGLAVDHLWRRRRFVLDTDEGGDADEPVIDLRRPAGEGADDADPTAADASATDASVRPSSDGRPVDR